jgi:putative transcriptional regulator
MSDLGGGRSTMGDAAKELIGAKEKPQILVAMPSLKDGYFDKSVILLCEYNESGAMGFVINSPSTTSVDDLLRELGLNGHPYQNRPIMIGGPVQPELCWVVHSGDYEGRSTTALGQSLCLSAAQEVLTSITEGVAPEHYLLGVGYAGWGPGQLDREIEQEAWWLADLDPLAVLQHTCEDRWEKVMEHLGLHKTPYYCTSSCRA